LRYAIVAVPELKILKLEGYYLCTGTTLVLILFLFPTMNNLTGIYKITNLINNKCYIGQTNNIPRRWSEHKSALNRNLHHNEHLQKSWLRYGERNFKFEVLEYCSLEELNTLEEFYVSKFNSYKRGYNRTVGADGKGKAMSQEAREKIRKAKLGTKMDEKVKEHLRKIRANPVKATNKKTGEELIFSSGSYASRVLKIRGIGHVLTGKRMSAGGYYFEYIDKERNKESEEKRVKLFKAYEQKSLSLKKNQKPLPKQKSKPVKATHKVTKEELTFNSITEASKTLNILQPNISLNLKRKTKSAGGYTFEYTHVQPF
jgi:group I intron endonuclease